jgi:hypothetical protein
MWYMPYLRVRYAVQIYVYFAIAISLLAVALRFWPGAVHTDAHEHLPQIDVSMLLAASAALVGGFATVLGLNLAAENDGHLEVAWTKPVSREGYALGVFAVDIAAMAACILFTVVCAAAVIDVYAGYQILSIGSGDALVKTLAFCGWPLCIYAWIAALSASLKRNRGAVAGLFWPLMAVLGALQFVRVPAVHALSSALNLFNPIVIYQTTSDGPHTWMYLWGWGVAALLLAAALFQWRRLQL